MAGIGDVRERISALGEELSDLGQALSERASTLAHDIQESDVTPWVAGGVIGLGIGVILGLLLAPESGAETRTKLTEAVSGVAGRACSPGEEPGNEPA